MGIACDIRDSASVETLAKKAEELRRFRVLAHVAGLSPSMGSFADIIQVNLRGAALVAEQLLPLASAGTAAILISSLAAHLYQPGVEVEAILKQPLAPDLVAKLSAAVGDRQATPQNAHPISKYGLMAYCRRKALAWGQRGARSVLHLGHRSARRWGAGRRHVGLLTAARRAVWTPGSMSVAEPAATKPMRAESAGCADALVNKGHLICRKHCISRVKTCIKRPI
ncbi:SDR family oxidoreductase [Hydrocarboniphaga sp.]|uniref:SDR family oxidoreductase n=1 Tax=Hydrocarboniphaga sp. TaxID=2033016 RepID=UPI00345651A6